MSLAREQPATGSQRAGKPAVLAHVRRTVVKVGSSIVTGREGTDRERMASLAAEIGALRVRGLDVLVVSSGAIAAGRNRLPARQPLAIPERQAAAAMGQIDLMLAYRQEFSARGMEVAQVLLTRDDVTDRERYLNAKRTLETLFTHGVVPIVNENDTVAVEEIKFGDNDTLSALVATLIDADLLVILTDVPGLLTDDPCVGTSPRLIPLIERLGPEVDIPVSTRTGRLGSGGMRSKLNAARTAFAAGIPTVIADGREAGILSRVFDPAAEVGTLVLAHEQRPGRRKHWIAHTLRPAGTLWLDEGACSALRHGGRSLLPSGIRAVEGSFVAGDCVRCVDPEGHEFARGLVNYAASELNRITGLHSSRIETVLGYTAGDEVIHRDDLALLEQR